MENGVMRPIPGSLSKYWDGTAAWEITSLGWRKLPERDWLQLYADCRAGMA